MDHPDKPARDRISIVVLTHNRPAELARWIREAGLSHHAFKGMSYNPLTRIYSLNQDTSVNYLVACRKPAISA